MTIDNDNLLSIVERITCLKNFWQELDVIHARQKSGMKSLWGLVEDRKHTIFKYSSQLLHHELYREHLSADLIANIEGLWGTTILKNYPNRIVSEPFPHTVMAETFGAALRFWHNCSLTAWFLCEEADSVTNMQGLAHHQRKNLIELENAGFPVDESMFRKLIEVEKIFRLDEEVEIVLDEDEFSQLTTYGKPKAPPEAFEQMRNTITYHRQKWAETYLENYLDSRWTSETNLVTETIFQKKSKRPGKLPEPKQIASIAASLLGCWFGGNISLLYVAIGEEAPFQTERHTIMPQDITGFVKSVAELLPSREISNEDYKRRCIQELAKNALDYVQIYEAKGANPTLEDFSSNFRYYSILSQNINEAWQIYESTIEQSLQYIESKTQ